MKSAYLVGKAHKRHHHVIWSYIENYDIMTSTKLLRMSVIKCKVISGGTSYYSEHYIAMHAQNDKNISCVSECC